MHTTSPQELSGSRRGPREEGVGRAIDQSWVEKPRPAHKVSEAPKSTVLMVGATDSSFCLGISYFRNAVIYLLTLGKPQGLHMAVTC